MYAQPSHRHCIIAAPPPEIYRASLEASKRRHRQKLPRAQWNQRPHRQKCKASSDPTPEITILFAQGTAKFVLFPKAFRFFSELKGLPSSYCSPMPSGIFFSELKRLPLWFFFWAQGAAKFLYSSLMPPGIFFWAQGTAKLLRFFQALWHFFWKPERQRRGTQRHRRYLPLPFRYLWQRQTPEVAATFPAAYFAGRVSKTASATFQKNKKRKASQELQRREAATFRYLCATSPEKKIPEGMREQQELGSPLSSEKKNGRPLGNSRNLAVRWAQKKIPEGMREHQELGSPLGSEKKSQKAWRNSRNLAAPWAQKKNPRRHEGTVRTWQSLEFRKKRRHEGTMGTWQSLEFRKEKRKALPVGTWQSPWKQKQKHSIESKNNQYPQEKPYFCRSQFVAAGKSENRTFYVNFFITFSKFFIAYVNLLKNTLLGVIFWSPSQANIKQEGTKTMAKG